MSRIEENVWETIHNFFLYQIFNGEENELVKLKEKATLKDLCVDSLETTNLKYELEEAHHFDFSPNDEITPNTTIGQIRDMACNYLTMTPA